MSLQSYCGNEWWHLIRLLLIAFRLLHPRNLKPLGRTYRHHHFSKDVSRLFKHKQEL